MKLRYILVICTIMFAYTALQLPGPQKWLLAIAFATFAEIGIGVVEALQKIHESIQANKPAPPKEPSSPEDP